MTTDLEALEAEIERQNAEAAERIRLLEAENERLRQNQRGQPLPAAQTLRDGYADSDAQREARKAGAS